MVIPRRAIPSITAVPNTQYPVCPLDSLLSSFSTAEAVAVRWGAFVNTVINFLIIAFVIFMIVKAYNNSQKKEEPAPEPPAGPTTDELLTEIRDLLKKS